MKLSHERSTINQFYVKLLFKGVFFLNVLIKKKKKVFCCVCGTFCSWLQARTYGSSNILFSFFKRTKCKGVSALLFFLPSIKKKRKRGASRLSSDAFKLLLSCLDVSERAPHFSSDWRQWWGRGGAGPQLAGSLRAGRQSSEIISSVTCRFFFISEDAWGGRFMAVGSRWRTHIYQLHTNMTESRLIIFFFFYQGDGSSRMTGRRTGKFQRFPGPYASTLAR